METVLTHARLIVPFDSGGIMLYDAGTQLLIPRAVLGLDIYTVEPVAMGDGIIGQVAVQQHAIRVRDMQADDRCVFIDPDSRSELAIPVISGGMLRGVLNIESHAPDAYTSEHEAAAQSLAEQIAQLLSFASALKNVEHERDGLRYAVRVQQRENRALKRLAYITSRTLNFDDMLQAAVSEAADLLDCDGARVMMPNEGTYSLVVHGPSSFGVAADWELESLPLDGAWRAVHVYHTGEQYINSEPEENTPPDCYNRLICPLNTRNRTLGVLELTNQRSGRFSDSNIEIAQTIANQIAVSMDSVRRLEEEQRRTELMGQINHISQELYATLDPRDLLRHLAQMIRAQFGYDAVHVLLLTPDGHELQVQASSHTDNAGLPDGTSVDVDTGILGQVLRTGQSTIIPNVREVSERCGLLDWLPTMQSCLIVSLRQGDETIGTLAISSKQLYAFSDLDRDALEMLGRQLSVALENAHLYHQAQRRLIEQGIVHQIGQDLSAILDYRELVKAVVRHMNRALNASGCLLALYDAEQAAVHVEADFRAERHRDTDGELIVGKYLTLETHPAIREAIRTREPYTTYREDPDLLPASRELLQNLGDHSQLVVPVVAGDRVIGIVDWTDNQPGRRFTPDDILLARTLVAQAMIALENALLFRQLEQRADELAEAYRLRSQFLATISHELRTPMNSIIGFSETLLDGIYGDLSEEQSSRLDRIRRNSYTLLALIDDLLDLSKIEAGRMTLDVEVIGVGDAAHTALDSLRAQAEAKQLSIEVDIPDDLPRVEADPQRLYQVIKNLISNAIKFTHEGGITVRCAKVVRQGRSFIQTDVTDTGIGIDEEAQAFIFDSFRQADGSSTRAYGGTGMGLTISKKLIEMMGGSIWVEHSRPGAGSTFSFALPVAPAERTEQE